MSITINEIRLITLSIDAMVSKVSGSYEMLGNKGRIVAKQGFNGYNDILVEISKETKSLLEEFMDSLSDDIKETIGVNEAVKEINGKD